MTELIASGYYYNEISGQYSEAPLTLSLIVDLSGSSRCNVNLLTTIEQSRVKYLVSCGSDFSEAKEQAKREILIFNINNGESSDSKFLYIFKSGDENAMLLAISLIMQMYRGIVELSELLTNISSDIMEDGVLNDARIGSSLINHAKYLNTQDISTNI